MQPGIHCIYKPRGITSYDVIRKIKTLTNEQRIGHGGTLDPFACGVLVVAIGKEYTKQLHAILHNTTKVYRATIALGATSTTDDPEGAITTLENVKTPELAQVKTILKTFEGEIMQTPPAFSAIKQAGKRAYDLARQGKEVTLEPRKVTINAIKLLRYEYPDLEIEVECQSGVYIRALARDIGRAIGTGGYCLELERIRVGDYKREEALEL